MGLFSPAGQALETVRPDVACTAVSVSGGLNSKLHTSLEGYL